MWTATTSATPRASSDFRLEPRTVFEMKGVVPRLTPIESLGYLQILGSHCELGAFRLGTGLAFQCL